MKTLRIEIGSQRDTIRETRFDVELIEDAVPIGGAAVFFRGFFFLDQPLGMLGLEVIVRVAKERLRSGDEFGIGVAEA